MNFIEHFKTLSDVNLPKLQEYIDLVTNPEDSDGYKEVHHILPKSLFPSYKNDAWNLVKLSARQHYLAHKLLWEAIPTNKKIMYAFYAMVNLKRDGRDYSVDADTYAKLKEEHAISMREQTKRLIAEGVIKTGTFKGRNHTEESKEKNRLSHIGTKNPKSDDWRRKVSESLSGENNPMHGIRPWNNPKTRNNNEALKIWSSAIQIYELYHSLNQCYGYRRKIASTLNIKAGKSLINCIDKIQSGWSPSQDQSWISLFGSSHV